MERLTERVTIRGVQYIKIKGCSSLYSTKERKGAYMHNAIVRLATYEDADEANISTEQEQAIQA